MSEYTDEKMDSILAKVRKLLERADHPGTPQAEADSSRARAEALMLKYRLDEAQAVMKGDSMVTPVWRDIDLLVADEEFASWYYQLGGVVMQHVGAKGVIGYRLTDEGEHVTQLKMVGYQSDINYAEMLLTASMIEFGKRLSPRYDPELSDKDNIYNMRQAGMERKRIAEVVYGKWTTENEMKAKNRKVTKAFRAACEERGEDADVLLGRGNNVKTYRKSYADGFVSTLHTRLIRMRTGQGEQGTGLVLQDRYDRVLEAYYTRFPQYRPKENTGASGDGIKRRRAPKAPTRPHNDAAFSRGGVAASMVDLGPNAAGRGRMGGAKDRGNSIG